MKDDTKRLRYSGRFVGWYQKRKALIENFKLKQNDCQLKQLNNILPLVSLSRCNLMLFLSLSFGFFLKFFFLLFKWKLSIKRCCLNWLCVCVEFHQKADFGQNEHFWLIANCLFWHFGFFVVAIFSSAFFHSVEMNEGIVLCEQFYSIRWGWSDNANIFPSNYFEICNLRWIHKWNFFEKPWKIIIMSFIVVWNIHHRSFICQIEIKFSHFIIYWAQPMTKFFEWWEGEKGKERERARVRKGKKGKALPRKN